MGELDGFGILMETCIQLLIIDNAMFIISIY